MIKIRENYPIAYLVNADELCKDDLTQIITLWKQNQILQNQLNTSFYRLEDRYETEFEQSFSVPNDYPLFILRKSGLPDGELIGFSTIEIIDNGILYSNSELYCRIEYFIVNDQFKGNNPAKTLWKKIVQWATDKGCERIDWSIPNNFTPAINFAKNNNWYNSFQTVSINL